MHCCERGRAEASEIAVRKQRSSLGLSLAWFACARLCPRDVGSIMELL
ncbi:hypothetical protein BVRB_4g085910 [Beta vulgaris subsp. vulgaris]|nr:hypothetical protein BVRB_4g085910 [Beta vulgaris subsp. vulgaris]